MQWISRDLRERIVAAYEAGEGSYRVLAERFVVSKAVVGKFVRQQRRLGTLEPQVHLRGRKRTITGEQEQLLRQHIDDKPDATLQERIDELSVDCCINTMWTSMKRLGCSFKKVDAGSRTGPRRCC